jgi:hypothetical protein
VKKNALFPQSQRQTPAEKDKIAASQPKKTITPSDAEKNVVVPGKI